MFYEKSSVYSDEILNLIKYDFLFFFNLRKLINNYTVNYYHFFKVYLNL